MNKLTLVALSLSLPFISACTEDLSAYKDDIHQGTSLDRFQINQLKKGMTKAQVHDLIGSPSVIDPFHNNQWDYINHSTLHNQVNEYHRLILNFSRGKLKSIDTSGISKLPALSDKAKSLEDRRIAEERVKNNAIKQAKKDVKNAQHAREEEIAIALEVTRFVNEQTKVKAIKEAKIEMAKKAAADAIIKAKADARALKIFRKQQAIKNKILAQQLRKEEEKARAKKLKSKRLAKEKAKAVLKAKTLEYKRLAEEEAKEALKAKTLEYKRLAEEEARALKVAKIAAVAVEEAERAREATEKIVEKVETVENPWYKFW
jgi:outer membrane protein assembly factor BamE